MNRSLNDYHALELNLFVNSFIFQADLLSHMKIKQVLAFGYLRYALSEPVNIHLILNL